MSKYEVKIRGKDGNTYYLPIRADSRFAARSEAYKKYSLLNFEVISIRQVGQRKPSTSARPYEKDFMLREVV